MTSLRRTLARASVVAVFAGMLSSLSGASSVAAVPGPTLTGPANNTTTAVKDVVLTWDAVAGASGYQVQISPNGKWTNDLVTLPSDGDTVRTTYEVPLSLPHASYYWRVRATVNGVPSAWSDTWQFLHDWYSALTMIKTPTSSDPTLSWNPVPEASEYRVRFSTDPTLKDSADCWTANTSFTPYADVAHPDNTCIDVSDFQNDTTYYWEVRAYDDSTAKEIPADTKPSESFECAEAQPECDAADQYGFFTFEAPEAGTVNDGTAHNMAAIWHNDAGTSDCTNALCPMTPTFSWDPVPGANQYEVHIYRDPYDTNTYQDFTTAWPELTPKVDFLGAQAGQAYYWTVATQTCVNSDTDPTCAQAATGAGAGGAQSNCDGSSQGPCVSGLSVSPAGASGDQSIDKGKSATVTLTGSGFQSGDTVTVNPNVGTITGAVNVASATSLSFTYNAPNQSTSVTFTVNSPGGEASNASPPLAVTASKTQTYAVTGPSSFKVLAGAVTLTAPASGAKLKGTNQTFEWQDYAQAGGDGAIDARNYDLQVATDSAFKHVVLEDQDIDMTRYTDPKNLPAGSYFWRVAPLDEDGNLLTWSDTRTVLSDATTPHLHLAAAGKDGLHQRGTFLITASSPLRHVSSSTLHVVPSTGGATLAGKLTGGATPTSWYFTPKNRMVTGMTYVLHTSGSVTDLKGNPAVVSKKGVRVVGTADNTNHSWHFSGHWARQSASNATNGSYSTASHGSSAEIKVSGATVAFYGCKAPSLGHVQISVNGKKEITLSEHQSFTRCGLRLWKGAIPSGKVTVRVAVTSGSGAVDAIRVS